MAQASGVFSSIASRNFSRNLLGPSREEIFSSRHEVRRTSTKAGDRRRRNLDEKFANWLNC